MNQRAIAVRLIRLGVIGIANILIFLGLFSHRTAASNSASASAAGANVGVNPNPSLAPASNAVPVQAPGADSSAAAPARRHPTPPPIQPGTHLERQVLTASGNLRVRYLRDREHNIRQIAIQDVHNPANETVLAQYQRTAWVVVSPNDDWIVLQIRDKAERGLQLFHRTNSVPLRYEVPAELQANGSGLREQIWQSYLQDTQQDSGTDARKVTIDATSWEPDSQRVTLSITPIPTRDNSAVPMAWTCLYNVNTKQVEPATGEVAENPQGGTETGAPNEITDNSESATDDSQDSDNNNREASATEQTEELEGEKFPATREEEITVQDANELELTDIKYAIFEMFARHGVEMHDLQMRKAFSALSWYQPQAGLTFDEAEKEFSEIEKHNLAILRRVRDAKIAAARRPGPKAIRGEPVQEEPTGEQVIRGVLQGVSDALGHP